MSRKRKLLIALAVMLLLVAGIVYFSNAKVGAPSSHKSAQTPKTSSQATNSNSAFDKQQYSTSDPTSIWVVVNKPRPLNPLSFAPKDLVVPSVPLRVPGNESMQIRQVTATALEQMFADAKQSNLNLMVSSGYRSYAYQVNLYNGYVKSEGQAAADTQSARPGHSEHQTGLAVDIEPASRTCEVDQCFADTPEGKWLAANAYKYGFIIRYPSDKVSITGYEFEPWHVRYVGVPLATEMHTQGIETLEEFFGLPGGPNY